MLPPIPLNGSKAHGARKQNQSSPSGDLINMNTPLNESGSFVRKNGDPAHLALAKSQSIQYDRRNDAASQDIHTAVSNSRMGTMEVQHIASFMP